MVYGSTTQNLEIVRIDSERNLILIKGSIPASKGGSVIVSPSTKITSNTKKQARKFSIKDLEEQRDLFLIEIMKTLNKNQNSKFPNWEKKFNKFK